MIMEATGLPQLTRRDALKAAAGLCGIALVAAGASTAQAAPAPSNAVKSLKGGRVKVALKKVPALRKVGGVATIGDVRGIPTAVVRTGKKTYLALDLRCTHQGYTVVESGNGFRCPLHGSIFTDTGQKVSGPAVGPLRQVRSRRKKSALFVG